VLFKFVLPAGVCAGLLVVTFSDVSCFGFGFFAVQCASRFWVGFAPVFWAFTHVLDLLRFEGN
jgi:hypothetical protein